MRISSLERRKAAIRATRTQGINDGLARQSVDDDDNDDTVFRVRDMLPAGILALLELIGLVLASLSAGHSTGQYLVIAAPWQAQVADLVWRAGGGVTGFGNLSPVAVAMSDQPGFAGMLRKQGAWIVLPAPRALGCFHPRDGGRR